MGTAGTVAQTLTSEAREGPALRHSVRRRTCPDGHSRSRHAATVYRGHTGPKRTCLTTVHTMANEADEFSSFDEAIEHMPDSHLHCRDYGHSWRTHSARFLQDQRAYERTLRCTRCRTLRHQLLDSRGARISSHYEYVPHYLVKGVGRLTGTERDALRLRALQNDMGRSNVSPIRKRPPAEGRRR